MTYIADSNVELSAAAARKVIALMDEVEDLEDVNNVYTNFEMTAEPDMKVLGPMLKGDSGKVRELLLEKNPRELAEEVKGGGMEVSVNGSTYRIGESDLRFHEVLGERWALGDEDGLEVLIDLELTGELVNEGIAREVVRRIQTMRKDMDLDYDARIKVAIAGDPDITSGVESYIEYISSETLSDSLEIRESVEGTEWKLDQGKLVVGITL